MIEKELDFHTLEILFPVIPDGSAYYLLSASSFDDDPRKVIFQQRLSEEMQASQ
jgi:hypothetical protein